MKILFAVYFKSLVSLYLISVQLFAESSIKQSFRRKCYPTLDPIVPFLLLYMQVNNDKPLLSSRRNAFAVESRYFQHNYALTLKHQTFFFFKIKAHVLLELTLHLKSILFPFRNQPIWLVLVSVVFLTKLSKYFRLTRIRKFKILINIDVVKVSNRRRIDMESNEKKILILINHTRKLCNQVF